MKLATIRLVLSFALSNGWMVRQFDFNNAFLNGDLVKYVYMTLPKGFLDSQNPQYVCKLSKALYSLKQALRAWFEKLKQILLGFGLHNSQADTSLFILKSSEVYVLLLVYVDDILITGNNSKFI